MVGPDRNNPESDFLTGYYRDRLNRFVMEIELSDGDRVRAFCPNTSRLIGLLKDGAEVLLTENDDPERKTNFTVKGFRNNDTWVGIEAIRANELFDEYLSQTSEDRFGAYSEWDREVPLYDSQIDFCRRLDERSHWIEVKSLSSRSESGEAFYSGTTSERGYRHLADLSRAVEEGDRADCVFVVQRSDVEGLSPAAVTQEDWLHALRSADEAGVNILAFRCVFDGNTWRIEDSIPTEL
ncbi:MAG: DNA/RNA nuclease SfsA [bacterium]